MTNSSSVCLSSTRHLLFGQGHPILAPSSALASFGLILPQCVLVPQNVTHIYVSDLTDAGLGGCGLPGQGHCPLLQRWILAAFRTGTGAQGHMAKCSVQGMFFWAVALATHLSSTSLPSDGSKQPIGTRCVCDKLGCWLLEQIPSQPG